MSDKYRNKTAYLELVLEDVLLGGHLAIQAQQALLVGAQRLDRH